MAYRLITADGGYDVARVEWEGRVDHTAQTLLGDRLTGPEAEARSEAERWLEDYLAQQGSAQSGAVKLQAKKAGISTRTIERAAVKLGVTKRSEGFPCLTYWSLPNTANADETTSDAQKGGETGETEADLPKQDGETGNIPQSRHAPCDGGTRTRTEDPPCHMCHQPVVSEHQDNGGNSVHFECQKVQPEQLLLT